MNNKKVFFVIFIAVILAFLVALYLPKRSNSFVDTTEKITVIEDVSEENQYDIKEDSTLEENKQGERKLLSEQKVLKTESNNNVKKEELVFEKLQSEEPAKLEQAGISFEDAGVIDDNGTIVVTRSFKVKSPDKYCFEGFGIQKAPIK